MSEKTVVGVMDRYMALRDAVRSGLPGVGDSELPGRVASALAELRVYRNAANAQAAQRQGDAPFDVPTCNCGSTSFDCQVCDEPFYFAMEAPNTGDEPGGWTLKPRTKRTESTKQNGG
jgi:hypothetical protein